MTCNIPGDVNTPNVNLAALGKVFPFFNIYKVCFMFQDILYWFQVITPN